MVKKQKGGASVPDEPFYEKMVDAIRNGLDHFYTDKMAQKSLIKYSIISLIFIIVCIIIGRIISNTGSASYNIQKYFFIYTIPLVVIFALLIFSDTGGGVAGLLTLLKLIGGFVLIGLAVYFFAQTTGPDIVSGYAKYTLLVLIVLIGLGIFYNKFIGVLRGIAETDTWTGFFVQLLFYIPCTLYDLLIYIIDDGKTTPSSIYILMVLEIILIMVYLYLPNMVNYVTGLKKGEGKQLLSGVYFLNQGSRPILTSDDLRITATDDEIAKGSSATIFRRNYAISMWIYINAHSPSSKAYQKETEIFSYGYADASGVQHVKPMIRYYGGGNYTDQPVERNKLVFYFAHYPPKTQYESDDHTFYDVTIPTQKWNQIVLNYRENDVDLYINGSLERTFHMGVSLPLYSDLDNIKVGSDDDLDGGICNVAYYEHPLTKDQIVFSYNAYAEMNPPAPRTAEKTPWEKMLVELVIG